MCNCKQCPALRETTDALEAGLALLAMLEAYGIPHGFWPMLPAKPTAIGFMPVVPLYEPEFRNNIHRKMAEVEATSNVESAVNRWYMHNV